MSERNMIHLAGSGMGKRAVRYRILSTGELQHVEKQAARGVTKDTTIAEYELEKNELGRQMFIVEVSDPVSGKDPRDPSVKWAKVDAQTLATQWGTFFNTKDTETLKAIYDREHKVTAAEVEAIMAGKVVELGD